MQVRIDPSVHSCPDAIEIVTTVLQRLPTSSFEWDIYTAPYRIMALMIVALLRKRIVVPDVCNALGVICLTPLDMRRREGARFVAYRAP